MAHWRESIRDRFLEFEYESLVADPETYIVRMFYPIDGKTIDVGVYLV